MNRNHKKRRAARHAAEREELAQLRIFKQRCEQYAAEALAEEPRHDDFADTLEGLSAYMMAVLAWGREAALRARLFETGTVGVAALAQVMRERDDYRARKDEAYRERNRVVALLARLFPSGIARTAIEGWDEEWQGCVYIDLPTGQVSWHYHDSEALLFIDLPPYTGGWDGHNTAEKYSRVSEAAALLAAADSDDWQGPARTGTDGEEEPSRRWLEFIGPEEYPQPSGRSVIPGEGADV